jgi:formamidopyrimidine-DNA glycosylase
VPELPEVEILVRHLDPLLAGKTIRQVDVRREKVIRPTAEAALRARLTGATFVRVQRRGKYLVFQLRRPKERGGLTAVGHLGMTGRMYLQAAGTAHPTHAALVLGLGRLEFIFEDPRYFGRFTLDAMALQRLGPEPLSDAFTPHGLRQALARSGQPIKPKLLDQQLVAGVGNIYASEALFRARLSPRRKARALKAAEVHRLWESLREVLSRAIEGGSTVPLDFSGRNGADKLFYYGRSAETPDYYEEELQVYGRAGQPCPRCAAPVKRILQAARSTYYCPRCQS